MFSGIIKKLSLSLVFLVFLVTPMTADAELTEGQQSSVNDVAEALQAEERGYGPYKDEVTYYQDLDIVRYDEIQELEADQDDDEGITWNPINIVGNYISDTSDDVLGQFNDMITDMFLFLISVVFQLNIMLTEFMLSALDLSMENLIVNLLIVISENVVSNIAGIDGGTVDTAGDGTGIFGTLVPLFSVIAIVYMAYQFVFKRAPIEGMKAVLHPIAALVVAIFLISNMSMVLQTMNNVANEITNTVSTATSADSETMSDSIHEMFIHKPYLYLQFDSANEESIGRDTIETILLNPQDHDDKRQAIQEQYAEGNTMMTSSGTQLRAVYSGLFLLTNAFMSLPIWALSFLLLGLQLLFIIVAALAPFYLIVSILPGQFGVLIRYIKLLLMPLALQIFVSFIALVVFTINHITFSIPGTDGLMGYFAAVFVQFVVFGIVFLFRKKLMDVFKGTTGFVRQVMDPSRAESKGHGGDLVRNTAGAVGAGVGAVYGGPTGAAIGYSAGNTVGGVATGQQGIGSGAMKLASINAISGGSAAGEAATNTAGKKASESATKGTDPTKKTDSNTEKSPTKTEDKDKVSLDDKSENESGNNNKERENDSNNTHDHRENIDQPIIQDGGSELTNLEQDGSDQEGTPPIESDNVEDDHQPRLYSFDDFETEKTANSDVTPPNDEPINRSNERRERPEIEQNIQNDNNPIDDDDHARERASIDEFPDDQTGGYRSGQENNNSYGERENHQDIPHQSIKNESQQPAPDNKDNHLKDSNEKHMTSDPKGTEEPSVRKYASLDDYATKENERKKMEEIRRKQQDENTHQMDRLDDEK